MVEQRGSGDGRHEVVVAIIQNGKTRLAWTRKTLESQEKWPKMEKKKLWASPD